MAQDVLDFLRRLNRVVAIVVGIGLLACVIFVLSDIILRQVGASFGGTDEIAGYVMAISAAWGMAFTLLELGHVRIDLLRSRLAARGRVLMDLFSLAVLAGAVSLIALRCWPVVEKSIANNSTANTVLETPLWLVQVPWFAGWAWFAVMSWATLIAALMLFIAGRFDQAEAAIGAFGEQDSAL
ncbi:TRAP transporter small permease subunit [Oceaniglobus indicus]|uniref:TRAP transporter small permease subunit n=1 Tax=Oceaniglobus indicus TaxID=2047749 RepID=UPI000C1816DB|nr:TRAP transporter small permease [Oceaniglobus indicus]